MKIDFETGIIEGANDLRIETLISVPVKELKKIGDNETLGALFVKLVHEFSELLGDKSPRITPWLFNG